MSLPDLHSGRLRRINSNPRRRRSDPEPRRRKEDQRRTRHAASVFLTTLLCVFFLGYVDNVGGFATAADNLATGLNATGMSQTHASASGSALLLPVIVLLSATVILFIVFRAIFVALRDRVEQHSMAKREIISLQKFKHVTRESGIRPRVATQGYRLLLPFYQSSMCTRTDERLREDLHMSKDDVQRVLVNLLRMTERKAPLESPIRTVMDLLKNVQNSPRQLQVEHVPRTATVRQEASASGEVPARKKRSRVRPGS